MASMNEQEKIEQALKDIHVLFSKCEYYNDDKNMIIVNKRELFRLLERINLYMYEMMDEFEITQQSKARGERKARQKGDNIIEDATKKADDVYAAAMLYTDDALARLRERISMIMEEVDGIYENMHNEMAQEDALIADNQRELREQLEEMKESEKYISVLDAENEKRQEQETEEMPEESTEAKVEKRPLYKKVRRPDPEKDRFDEPIKIVAPAPEIKINPDYEENLVMDTFTDGMPAAGSPQVSVNLDAEYFKWKNDGLEDFEEGVVDENGELAAATEEASASETETKKTASKLMGALFGKK